MAMTRNKNLQNLKQRLENTCRLGQNIVNTQAYLDKQIDGGDPDKTSVAAGGEVSFDLISNVPEDLTNYLKPEEPEDPVATVSVMPLSFDSGQR